MHVILWEFVHLHIGFVVGAYLLDPDVILGVNERFCSRVGLSDGHHTGNVLEIAVIVNFNLSQFPIHVSWQL